MKKLMTIGIAVLVTGSTTLHAQKNTPAFGLRAGLNLSNIIKTGDNNYSSEIKPGFNAAAFLDLPIAGGFGLQPEVQFSQKGYRSTGSFLNSPYEYTTTSNFVEVPVLVKLAPTKNFAIVVGPQFSFLTSTVNKFKTPNAGYEDVVDNENDNLRKNILGGVAGIEASAGKFIFSARYSLDFQKNNGDGSASTIKYKNQVAGISFGFRL